MKWRWLLILVLPVLAFAAPAVTPPPGQVVGTGSPCGANQFIKTIGGVWTCVDDPGAGLGAPTGAQYWVGTADGTLSAEKNLGVLGTGLVLNTAGVPSIKATNTCTNQFPRSDTASAVWTCASVATTDLDFDVSTQTELDAHINDAAAAHAASAIGFTPVGTIAGDDVQEAVAEVATDAATALATHEADTTSVHGITDTSTLVLTTDTRFPAMTTPSALSAASQIPCSTPTMKISAGSAITLSDAKWLADGTYAGQACELINAHATFTITGPTTATIKNCGGSGSVVIGSADETPLYVWDGATWWQKGCISAQRAMNVNPVISIAACGTATNPVYDGGSGNTLELCLTGTQVTLKIQCSGANCPSTEVQNLMLLTDGAKPTCTVAHRFKVWPTALGAGVEDTFEVCRKLANDTYAWSSIDLP